jgi:choline dehydrogenase-like flavoprotein
MTATTYAAVNATADLEGADPDSGYDVVIVGAGIAGSAVAKTVADEGGKRILVLEAGPATALSTDKYASHVTRFQEALAKVPNSPYPASPYAPQPDVLDLRQIVPPAEPNVAPTTRSGGPGYFVQTGPLPFSSDYTRSLGGTTLHWLGTCLRMLPNDFRLHSAYGHGVDWPIGYDDLRPYYERAETQLIGVAGDVADQRYPGIGPDYFGDYDYPMRRIPPSYLDQQFSSALDGKTIELDGVGYPAFVSSTPQGRNSTPRRGYTVVGAPGQAAEGTRCEGNNNCIPICPAQAKYSSLRTIYDLMRRHPGDQAPTATRSSVRFTAQAVATRVLIDESGRIGGIAYRQYDDPGSPAGPTRVARGKVYVLAANAIETATLLLASRAANSSGQVGRNLMDHPLILTWGLSPQPLWGFRGPLSTSGIPMFRDGAFRSRHSAFRIEIGNEGWNFTSNAPYSTVAALIGGEQPLFGSALRRKIGEVIPRQFRMAFEMEQIPQSSNYVTIDPAYRDALGSFRPVIRYDLPDYVRAGMAAARKASRQMFAHLGVPPPGASQPEDFSYPADYTSYDPSDPGYLTYGDESFTFQGAGHVCGTHRMGSSRRTSVVDPAQRSWDHPNLYLVGCGNMPTIGTSNPTLTMSALALRAGDEIVKELRQP